MGDILIDGSIIAVLFIAVAFFCIYLYRKNRSYVQELDRKNTQLDEKNKQLDEKNKQIQKITLQTIATIANTIDAKDEYTRGHSRRVAEYACAIGRELELPEIDIRTINSVALLHDIGKIGVPDFVLNKPGALSAEEYQMMKQHTIIGGEILKDIRMIPWLDIGAKYHHERYDGKGYPEGLSGDQIPFIARIIAVADAYDAMTSNRVYRKRLTDEMVLEELRQGCGKQFDPNACKTMIRLIEEKRLNDISPDMAESIDVEDATVILKRAMEQKEERLATNVVRDELTGTYKRGYGEKLTREVFEQTTGCLLLFDIDRFYRINANAGYIQGDMFLQSVADCIRDIEDGLIVTRFGDDEFLVFSEKIKTEKDVIQKIGNFMSQIQRKNEEWETPERLSVSVGIVFCGEEKVLFSEMLQKVDQALLIAKQQGGACYHIYRKEELSQEKNLSSLDLNQLLMFLRSKGNYTGAFRLSYPEFGRIYEFIEKVARRNGQKVQLMMFTVASGNNQRFTEEEREYVMEVLENAIVKSVRGVDVTTKYSSTQRLVLLMNLDTENIHIVTERITKEFYKTCNKRGVRLYYDAADLDMDMSTDKDESADADKAVDVDKVADVEMEEIGEK